ncbi:helix-turn-helix domain-containing protein [Methylotuvimicrobium sp. KM1]|uniref:helix-turn-helix domain-containing protein n=1 Tax=Methylotuvimicrobium sp. KM1 TaxID=3377707 RepID=UPI00384F6058
MALKSFKKLLADAKQRDSYWVEKAKLDFSVALNHLFEKSGMSQKALAEKLGASPAYITKVFRGDVNFTIETMTKLARAVDGQLHIHISPKHSKSHWFDVLQTQKQPEQIGNEWKIAGKKTNDRISTAA